MNPCPIFAFRGKLPSLTCAIEKLLDAIPVNCPKTRPEDPFSLKSMPKLSLCMIVKNESANLAQCLDSVKDVVDEMIVMDTGSTDDTIDIAKTYGAKVPLYAWQNNFSEARNEALGHVTGEWVLVLDADEVFNAAIVPTIRQAMENDTHLAINFLRQEIGADQSPYSLVSRLFRKHPQVNFTRPYHSIIDDTVAILLKTEPLWKIVEISAIGIFHYGYTSDKIKSLGKFDRARKAMEGFYKTHPHDPYVCSKLGALYLKIGKEKEGLRLLKQGLKSHGSNPHILYELHYHLANAYLKEKDIDKALKHYKKSLEQPILDKLKIGSYNNMGGLLQVYGELEQAKKAFEITVSIDPEFAMGYYNIGMILRRLERFPEAIKAYQKAIAINPNYAAAYQNLGVALLKSGNYPDSVNALQTALQLLEVQGDFTEAERIRQNLQAIGVEST
jgi:glycosyltransferase involved in cell wall biosynthesis